MARKYEFRPDSNRNGLLQRLHMTQQQRRIFLKWVLHALLLVLLSVVQDVILTPAQIFGSSTNLVPCAIIMVCITEGVENGSLFALVASILYLFSGTAPGPYAMVLITLLAILVSAFRQGYLRKGFTASMLCTGVAMLVYELALFFIGLFLNLTVPNQFMHFILTALLSTAVAPLLYLLTRAISAIGGESWKE